jgi:curved DNA-binding protein CbpA
MNPYDVLGVARDAAAPDVRAAYRRLAKEHHPDHEGDAARFREVQAAYDVLSDPARRDRYDRTGETDEPRVVPPHAAFLETVHPFLVGVVLGMARGGLSPDRVDVLHLVRDAMRKADGELRQKVAGFKKSKEILAAVAAKFEVKGGGENLLDALAKGQLRMIEEDLKTAEAEQARIAAALEELKKYGYKLARDRLFTLSASAATTGGYWGQW